MSNVTLYVPDDVKHEMENRSEIKWSEVIRKAILAKLVEIKKLELLRKFIEKEPFTEEDLWWMDNNDWHPVDEKQMRLDFVKEVGKRGKGKPIRAKSVDEIFK
ncbi:MAG: hypothetical protein V1861_01155 [Candidatus Micrarchaeota archaeon]